MNSSGIIGHARQMRMISAMLKNGMVPQALLFTGIDGIGKRLAAKRLLAAFFCGAGDPPCLACTACRQVSNETHPDMIVLSPNEKGVIPIGEMTGRETGTVRWMIGRLSRMAVSGGYGVIISGIDRISREGEIALLKTIEEPPAGTHIIMLASNKSEILPTIVSRCTEIHFSPLKDNEVREVLDAAGAVYESDAISVFSGGSVEAAMKLAGGEVLKGIRGICAEISGFLNSPGRLNLDLNPLLRTIDESFLLTVLINIYRAHLAAVVRGEDFGRILPGSEIHDEQKVRSLIKILLALFRGLNFNINFRNSFKGMLYSLAEGGADEFLPDFI